MTLTPTTPTSTTDPMDGLVMAVEQVRRSLCRLAADSDASDVDFVRVGPSVLKIHHMLGDLEQADEAIALFRGVLVESLKLSHLAQLGMTREPGEAVEFPLWSDAELAALRATGSARAGVAA